MAAMPVSPTAVAILEFGRILHDRDRDAAKLQQAEEELVGTLHRDRSASLKQIFGFNVGKADKVASAELANMIMKRARISDFMIGNIDVEDRESIVEVHKDVALKVINAMKGADLKGKKVEITPVKRK